MPIRSEEQGELGLRAMRERRCRAEGLGRIERTKLDPGSKAVTSRVVMGSDPRITARFLLGSV